jgi:hypothetical protein
LGLPAASSSVIFSLILIFLRYHMIVIIVTWLLLYESFCNSTIVLPWLLLSLFPHRLILWELARCWVEVIGCVELHFLVADAVSSILGKRSLPTLKHNLIVDVRERWLPIFLYQLLLHTVTVFVQRVWRVSRMYTTVTLILMLHFLPDLDQVSLHLSFIL